MRRQTADAMMRWCYSLPMKTNITKTSPTPSVVPTSSAAVSSGFTLGLDLGDRQHHVCVLAAAGLPGPRQRDGHVPRLRDDELLHFHRDGRRRELGEQPVGQVGGELLNEPPFAALAKLQQPLRDGIIIKGVGKGIALRGGGEIGGQHHGEQQALRLRAFRVRHPNAVKHFQVNDGNL